MASKGHIVGAVSAAAVALVAGFEGIRHYPYLDTGNVPTVCYGHTHNVQSRFYPEEECDALLMQELRVAGAAVHRSVGPLPQPIFDSMSSFTYNVGQGAFARSTLAKHLRAGRYEAACMQLDRWVYVAGKDCRNRANNCYGIVTRRAAERDLCLQGVN
jgi:lysozyme